MRAKSARKLRRSPVPPEGELLLGLARSCDDPAGFARIEQTLRQGLDWDLLLELAHWHGLSPLVWWKLKCFPAGLIPEPVQRQLQDRFLHASARHQILTRELLDILERFADCGLRAIPLKGPTLIARLYAGIPLRESTDLDILVAAEGFSKAKRLLEELGYLCRPSQTPWQAAGCVRAAGEIAFTRADGVTVDLHVRLGPPWFHEPLLHDLLWPRLITVPLGHTRVPSLGDEDLLVYLCYHGGKSLWSGLKWVCDIDRLVSVSRVDWREIERRAVACGCWRMVRLGLLLAQENLGAPIPPGLLECPLGDKTLRALARCATDHWFSFDWAPRGFKDSLLRLRLQDLLWRRFLGLARLLVTPSAGDWSWAALPPQLSFLYYFLRPLRLGCKYTVGRVLPPKPPGLLPQPPLREVQEISADSIVVRSGEFNSCRVDGTLVLVNLADGRSFALDEAAERTWELLANPSRVSTVCQLVSGARAAPDTMQLLRHLAHERAIKVAAGTTGADRSPPFAA